MKAGDTVVCIDDEGWLIPDPGFEHLSPVKGQTYVVAEYEMFGGVAAVSLVGGGKGDFYRACRFRVIDEIEEEREAEEPIYMETANTARPCGDGE